MACVFIYFLRASFIWNSVFILKSSKVSFPLDGTIVVCRSMQYGMPIAKCKIRAIHASYLDVYCIHPCSKLTIVTICNANFRHSVAIKFSGPLFITKCYLKSMIALLHMSKMNVIEYFLWSFHLRSFRLSIIPRSKHSYIYLSRSCYHTCYYNVYMPC